jgi:steroid delta-isomerase-like uncharacterized protein
MNLDKRLATVRSHIAAETSHDLDAVSATFNAQGRVALPSEALTVQGHAEIRAAHAGLFQGFPDLPIEAKSELVAGDSIVCEVEMSGTHLGAYRGMPPTGKSMCIRGCTIYEFDDDDLLSCEKVFLDRLSLLQQLR